MCSLVDDPMAQDKSPEQDIVVEKQELPQTNPKPKMATVCDTSPSLLRNPPPIPAQTARPGTLDRAQLVAILARMEANTKGMENRIMQRMDANMQAFGSNMRALRGEMRQVGQCLQAGKRTLPRAATDELKGCAPAGEDRVSRETCWARRVTETVTVTQREKVSGVTETCTSETGREVTEWTETRVMGTVEERLHGVEVTDAHTRTHTHTHR